MDVAHPLAALLSRADDEAAVEHLRLANLPVPSLVTMVAETLHVGRDAATGLVGAIERQTSGNPYETVELLNALRRDGLLTTTASGWRWDDAAIRRHLDQTEAAGLPAASIDALPAASRELVEAMACLGGRTELQRPADRQRRARRRRRGTAGARPRRRPPGGGAWEASGGALPPRPHP